MVFHIYIYIFFSGASVPERPFNFHSRSCDQVVIAASLAIRPRYGYEP